MGATNSIRLAAKALMFSTSKALVGSSSANILVLSSVMHVITTIQFGMLTSRSLRGIGNG